MLWLIAGYSLTFGESQWAGIIGNPAQHAFFIDVDYDQCGPHALTIPAASFAIFQMMFAVITPLLITGAFAERMKFCVYIPFIICWSLLVYYPVAHWIWGNGFMSRWGENGVLDFAGGITIHTTAGMASLVAAAMIGQREDFELYHGEFPPSNLPLAGTGAGLLCLGWFGFNGGSALGAGSLAVSAVVSTQIGAVSSGVVWLGFSWIRGKPATTALLNGLLAGLAGVTPASGYINSPASMLLGLCLGFGSYGGAYILKHWWHIDDALEVSMVHGLTGAMGAIFIGLFGQHRLNPNGADGAVYGNPMQLLIQFLAVVITALWSALITFILLKVLGWMFKGIRLSPSAEHVGGDWAEHGEVAYHKLHVLDENDRKAEEYRQFEETQREHNMEYEEHHIHQRHVQDENSPSPVSSDGGHIKRSNSNQVYRINQNQQSINQSLLANSRSINNMSPAINGVRSSPRLLDGIEPLPHSDMYRRQDAH